MNGAHKGRRQPESYFIFLTCTPGGAYVYAPGFSTPAEVFVPGILLEFQAEMASLATIQGLRTNLNNVIHRQAVDAIRNMTTACQRSIGEHGIDLNRVAATAAQINFVGVYIDGGTKVSMFGAGGTSTVSEYVTGSRAVVVVTPSGAFTNSVVLGAGYFGGIGYGLTVAQGQNITLVHESLHVQTMKGDIALAEQLGLGSFDGTADGRVAASRAISTFLASECVR